MLKWVKSAKGIESVTAEVTLNASKILNPSQCSEEEQISQQDVSENDFNALEVPLITNASPGDSISDDDGDIKSLSEFRNIEISDHDWNSDVGSDPVGGQSKGSKVYNRTVWLMEQIEREQRLRAGAEKLLRAASSKKSQGEIANELKIVNTNLQSLWEEMTDIISNGQNNNTSEVHQPKSSSADLLHPMIPLSMKETSLVDFQSELKNIFASHYHEDVEKYKFDLNCLTDMRKACCQLLSGEEGLEILFTYYNQLYFIDRRFFPANSNGPVSFKWYDAFSGLPYIQKTVGFEKGSILFNIGVMYSKMASKIDAKEIKDLKKAVENFQFAAGAFQFLHDNFLHAPSVDMQLASTEFLIHLMLTQASECRLELRLRREVEIDVPTRVELAQESSAVASMYVTALSMASKGGISGQIPSLWIPLITCKMHYHRALAHYHLATSLNLATAAETSFCIGALVRTNADCKLDSSVYLNQLLDDGEGCTTIVKAHLRQSILAFEESMRIVDKHRKFLRFHQRLKTCHDQSLSKFSVLEEEDDFTELFTPPEILPKVTDQLQPILPDFSKYKVEDLFHRLGCIAIFSSRHMWTAPRKVTLNKKGGEEFGFSIRGDSPVIVATIDEGSLAQRSGLLVGDFIVAVGGVDIKWTKHDKVVTMIKLCGDSAILHLVTPIDHNYIDPSQPPQGLSPQTTSKTMKQDPEFREEKQEKSKNRPSSASRKLRPLDNWSKGLGNDNCGFSPFSSR